MATTYGISYPLQLHGTIHLPASKSISARTLVVATIAGGCTLEGLSDCDDTRVLHRALTERPGIVDIMAAGTAMRFGTAFFAATPGEHLITGTARMKQRPIRLLVDALRTLGAEIEYAEAAGFPPLRISGRQLRGGAISIPADISSQYISALLMIAPTMTEGLTLHLTGNVVSAPYINMTLGIMKAFGADVQWTDKQTIRVAPVPYTPGIHYTIEPDWSAASYWYEMTALTTDHNARIVLPGLKQKSLQGDSVVAQLFDRLGVRTTYDANGIILEKAPETPSCPDILRLDFTSCPDLAQTLVATCAMLERPFEFCGLQSLKIKETDRIAALCTELQKMGCHAEADESRMWTTGSSFQYAKTCFQAISTYEDHRMAMAFAPCAYRFPGLHISRPEVVSKSYPSFWSDLQTIGADIHKTNA